ncbi:hypothetical protein [Pedobacter mendelii]|uniref:Uncharacterized protein n=1 Tax=Pedobacter mendelii TaxID=1908240 RepID=A0ABQ2BDZ3_9SPHI|nr:hypothetical protein [Pedobacter mendelii]GGI23740.1 hypothetical protein GCM10008119_09170 [Pedobacter mendelii]
MEEVFRQLKILKVYSGVLTLVVIIFIMLSLKTKTQGDFEMLNAERINIVQSDGKIRMVLSNKDRQHPGRMDGKDLQARDRPAGLLFFNDEGDECGGIGYNGSKKDAAMFFTMDQYKNDQILMLSYDQDNTSKPNTKTYGLTLNDRDDFSFKNQIRYFDSLKKLNDTSAYADGVRKYKSAGHLNQRMFIGKNKSGDVGLFLADAKGKPRLKIFINKDNQPVIQKLDEHGNIVDSK